MLTLHLWEYSSDDGRFLTRFRVYAFHDRIGNPQDDELYNIRILDLSAKEDVKRPVWGSSSWYVSNGMRGLIEKGSDHKFEGILLSYNYMGKRDVSDDQEGEFISLCFDLEDNELDRNPLYHRAHDFLTKLLGAPTSEDYVAYEEPLRIMH
jgi:hypothetical protein